MQECKSLNGRLVNFLKAPATLQQLIAYIVEDPKPGESHAHALPHHPQLCRTQNSICMGENVSACWAGQLALSELHLCGGHGALLARMEASTSLRPVVRAEQGCTVSRFDVGRGEWWKCYVCSDEQH